jgi:dTDP-4-dehydrorhamnose 3,5-epimerase-like enzyme
VAEIINLKTFCDVRGNLTAIERVLPFEIRRVFYIYGVDNSIRGGHRHHTTRQAAVCIKGTCTVWNNNGSAVNTYQLDRPDKCLILGPEDWHKMYDFSNDAILMVFASEFFNPDDYIYEKYPEPAA